jgi:broad specificity phosphatase PhoE
MARSAILIRHGEVENPDHVVYADLPGFGLSERGIRQAVETAQRLADVDVVAVYASPLQRAVETAEHIAAPHGLAVSTDPELTEWRLGTRWRGVGWDDLDEHFPGELAAYLDHPWDLAFSSESLADLAVRMAETVSAITARHDGGAVVVVSHQDPIQAGRLALLHRSVRGLNVDKPRHAEAFRLTFGAPWTEDWRWAPAEQESFPPSS